MKSFKHLLRVKSCYFVSNDALKQVISDWIMYIMQDVNIVESSSVTIMKIKSRQMFLFLY